MLQLRTAITRKPIDDSYQVNKARGEPGGKDAESDAQYEKRMKQNSLSRNSIRKARTLFQLTKVAHAFYDTTNTKTVQLFYENRLKIMDKLKQLKTFNHPGNPLYNVLQTDALEEYKKEFFVFRGQKAIIRFVHQMFTVFQL